MNRTLVRGLALVGAVGASFAANAAAPDFTTITAAVDWSTVNTALLAIGALLAGVLVVKKGVKFVVGMIGR